MIEIVTLARSSSNGVRSLGFPVLEAGNISFPNGRYAIEFVPGADRASFVLKHRLEGAPLISRLLAEDKARYVCTVSSPISSYRRTHLSSSPSQPIQWDIEDLGEPPLFTPMIVSVASSEFLLDKTQDGVHDVWHDQRVILAKGSRLALGQVVQLRSSILHLLSFHANEELKDGTFFVDAETEQGFQFRVNLSTSLHAFLQYPSKGHTRKNIMTHIVTACLALLQRDFKEDSEEEGGWESHRNLKAFAEFLKSQKLHHWADPEFHPEQVATTLYPHTLPQQQNGQE